MRGGRGLGWSAGRGGLEVCGCGAGANKISQTLAGAGRVRTKISTRAGP